MSRVMIDSRCEWLGSIPADWEMTNIGRIYEERNVKVSDMDYEPLSVTMNGIVPQLATVVKSDDRSNRKLVKKNDFVVNSRSDRRGAYGVSLYDGSCSLINIVLKPRLECDVAYYNYVLHTILFPDEFYRWGNGIVADLWATRWSSMKHIPLPAPCKAERAKIVFLLDAKCKEIDAVIEKTYASIDEYKKMRNGLITEVMTNGLCKNRSVKDSGSLWYGDIPAEWNLLKLRRVFYIKKEIAGTEGYTVLSITQRGIIPKDISKNEGQMAADYSKYQILQSGDFAMNHMDLLTGWVDISKYDGVTSPDYRVFTLIDKKRSNSRYYLYMLQMCYINRIFYSLGQGVSEFGRWRLQADKFLDFEVLAPSYEEQCEIAEYLNGKITEIDSLIAKKLTFISELSKYRKILIYEYVTGKKEVPQS